MGRSGNRFLVGVLSAAASVLFLTAALSVTASSARAQVLKVLSLNFNDETTVEDKDYRFRDRRFASIVEWIQQNDPDIVMIQEGFNFHHYGSVVKAIAEATGYDYNYRIGMGFPLVLYDSNGVLAKKKFHMSQRRFAKLPHGAPWFGDGKNWIVVLGAISWAVGNELTLDDGTPLYVYTAHLIGNTQTDRDDQMWGADQDIRAHIARNGEDYESAHVLLGGDFNSSPDSPGVRKLLANGYQDTFGQAHPGSDACTNCGDPNSPEFNPMTIAAGEFPAQDVLTGSGRIDHVLMHGPQMQTLASTLVFTAPVHGLWMSDHMGVYSTINVGGQALDPSAFANPLRDRTDLGKPAEVVHVTDGMLDCAGSSCELSLLGPVSWERGVTFVNDSQHKITVRVRPRVFGAGHVWARQHADLDPGHVAAYCFDPGIDYEFGVKGGSHAVFGTLQSTTP